MRDLGRVFCGLLLLGVAGCSSLSYYSDYDKQADFSIYQSFVWIGGSFEPVEGGSTDGAFFEGRVRSAVEEELAGMGFEVRSEGRILARAVMEAEGYPFG